MEKILNSLNFPEGPAFDREGGIWLVEKEAGNLIHIIHGHTYRYPVQGHPNGIAVDNDNLIWFCDSKQNSIRTFDVQTKESSTIVSEIDGNPLKMPNDLAFDNTGNLLFTCPGSQLDDGTGYICCLTPAKELILAYHGMFYPNGLAFSIDQKTLYVAETGTHDIWKFDWDTMVLELKNPERWANVGGPIGPDGMAFDSEGHLYVAVYGSSKVKVLNHEGKIVNEIQLDGANPTNCAIDPQGIQGLLITEAQEGTLIRYRTAVKGII